MRARYAVRIPARRAGGALTLMAHSFPSGPRKLDCQLWQSMFLARVPVEAGSPGPPGRSGDRGETEPGQHAETADPACLRGLRPEIRAGRELPRADRAGSRGSPRPDQALLREPER